MSLSIRSFFLASWDLAPALVGALVVLQGASVLGAETESDPEGPTEEPQVVVKKSTQSRRIFDEVLVTGGAEAAERIPGSAVFVGKEELRQQEYSDIHRILASVPGVSVQEEDGYGLRPNIGMRGTGVERSQKITLLEDGVLIAPAPYTAPAAYYSPTPGRMESVEVRKGSSAIEQGPYTNGGVINLVSSSIPSRLAGRVQTALGQDEMIRLHGNVGGSSSRLGWMFETYQLETDGFKRLDNGGGTGVELEDYVGKLRFNSHSSARVYQAIELKIGATDQIGDETYLGLAREDFAATPFRRYSASQRDRIYADHEQYQARYFLQPTSNLDFVATVYRNDFFRNWHKLQSVDGRSLSAVLDSPDVYSREMAILRGDLDDAVGSLLIRNNRRTYASSGLEARLGWDLETGRADHRLKFGVRFHEDEEDRFQEEDLWNQVDGTMSLIELGDPGSQSNRVSSADALAVFVRDEIVVGRWTLVPGIRVEDIDFERLDYGRSDPLRIGGDVAEQRNGVSVVLPGVGASYEVDPSWNVFGGVHRGFAPPGPGQTAGTEAEESLNFELGFNHRGSDLGTRVVLFYSDYDNLLGRDTLSTGGEGTGDAFNGGEVEVRGLEGSLAYDIGRARGWGAEVPLRLAYTYTEARFRSAFETSFADWAPSVEVGDHLPYIPEQQLSADVGVVGKKWSIYSHMSYLGDMRSKAGQGPLPEETKIDSRVILDLTLNYQLRSSLKIFGQMRNLGDETYLVARRPAGSRPGLPRTTLVGLSWEI